MKTRIVILSMLVMALVSSCEKEELFIPPVSFGEKTYKVIDFSELECDYDYVSSVNVGGQSNAHLFIFKGDLLEVVAADSSTLLFGNIHPSNKDNCSLCFVVDDPGFPGIFEYHVYKESIYLIQYRERIVDKHLVYNWSLL